MAEVSPVSLYVYVGSPTFNWVLQGLPWPSTVANGLFLFPGPMAQAPFKIRFRSASTMAASITINVGTGTADLYNTWYDLGTVNLTAGAWYEYTLSPAQASILSNNSLIALQIQSYNDPLIYTSGADGPKILTTDPHSARVKVGGSWKSGEPYVKVGGVWKKGELYVKVGGSWKKGT